MLKRERRDGVEILTIDRQGFGNSISSGLTTELLQALDELATDSALHAVVITGAGEKFFCTGGDVKEYRTIETPEDLNAHFERTRRAMDLLEALPVPVIAAVNGYALGGGAEILLCCDHRVADEGAEIGWPQSRLGIIPAWNGIDRLVRDCGPRVASRLMTTGVRIPASEALSLGIVDALAPPGEALDAALAHAALLREAAPMALRFTKKVIKATGTETPEAVRALQRDGFAELWFSADHKEAEAAFAEKRAPVFKGR
ncbi:MAG: enoyl-CoA hydratase/isomerase family protein [Alphaproteobacteria bacterium]|jgi:enoyl-CoA hydratase/carnithine racemase|nr:enoyl-CoA hydratase/isomerase family protein [Alphaproteobacteria bacterium]